MFMAWNHPRRLDPSGSALSKRARAENARVSVASSVGHRWNRDLRSAQVVIPSGKHTKNDGKFMVFPGFWWFFMGFSMVFPGFWWLPSGKPTKNYGKIHHLEWIFPWKNVIYGDFPLMIGYLVSIHWLLIDNHIKLMITSTIRNYNDNLW